MQSSKEKVMGSADMLSSFSWQNLPIDILPQICEKLYEIADHIRFGAVCHEWRQIHSRCRKSILPQPPVLLLPSILGINLVRNDIIFSTSNKHGRSDIELPFKYSNDGYIGSNYGWLIAFSGRDTELLNPFLSENNIIRLPVLPDNVNSLSLAVLSHNPTWASNYLVFIIFSSSKNENRMYTNFAYLKSGEKSWNSVYVGFAIQSGIYYNDRFYLFCYEEGFMCFDITSSTQQPMLSNVASSPVIRVYEGDVPSLHLVESRGELLCIIKENRVKKGCKVAKLIRSCIYREEQMDVHFTTGFQIFKYETRNNIWMEGTSLEGGQAVFVGPNSSVSVDVSKFPDYMPNHIYYQGLEEIKVGVYNVEDRSFKVVDSKGKGYPIWIQPTLDRSGAMISDESGAKRMLISDVETNELETIATPYIWDCKFLFCILLFGLFLSSQIL